MDTAERIAFLEEETGASWVMREINGERIYLRSIVMPNTNPENPRKAELMALQVGEEVVDQAMDGTDQANNIIRVFITGDLKALASIDAPPMPNEAKSVGQLVDDVCAGLAVIMNTPIAGVTRPEFSPHPATIVLEESGAEQGSHARSVALRRTVQSGEIAR